jgi:polygalacturonase
LYKQVIFEGKTTWAFKEWDGPLLQISGTGITVTGASGAYLDGNGAAWWDGEGDSGVTKPKFFYAHDLTDSTITNLHIQNTPVQAVSINGCDGLTITGMTIDNSAGDTDSLGHNTDGFDIGDSNNVVITGANVYNQDDCVAVNSGTVSTVTALPVSILPYLLHFTCFDFAKPLLPSSKISANIWARKLPSPVALAQVATVCL